MRIGQGTLTIFVELPTKSRCSQLGGRYVTSNDIWVRLSQSAPKFIVGFNIISLKKKPSMVTFGPAVSFLISIFRESITKEENDVSAFRIYVGRHGRRGSAHKLYSDIDLN